MNINDIVIRESFANTTPRAEKMKTCRDYWNQYHEQDRYIVVDRNNILVDGYIQYLVLKENGVEDVSIRIGKYHKEKRWKRLGKEDSWDTPEYRDNPTTYIFGKHPNSVSNCEYMWRIPSNWTWVADNVQIGDLVFCRTRYGVAPVVVNRIEIMDRCPVDYPVKKMCKKTIKRDGKLVE